jgi:hypothetical protein
MQDEYYFKQQYGEVILATDKNTIINYYNRRGGLCLLPTLRNRIVYRATAFWLHVEPYLQPVSRAAKTSLF